MARVALLCPDLLFGSKVEGALRVAGHAVNRFDTEERVRVAASFHDLLIVDLTAEGIDGAALVRSMRERGEIEAIPTLGFYSHVDQETRRRAEAAGSAAWCRGLAWRGDRLAGRGTAAPRLRVRLTARRRPEPCSMAA